MAALRQSMPMYRAKASMDSRCPFRRQRLGLLQDVLHSRILQVGRIAVFTQQALHQNPHVGASSLAVPARERCTKLN